MNRVLFGFDDPNNAATFFCLAGSVVAFTRTNIDAKAIVYFLRVILLAIIAIIIVLTGSRQGVFIFLGMVVIMALARDGDIRGGGKFDAYLVILTIAAFVGIGLWITGFHARFLRLINGDVSMVYRLDVIQKFPGIVQLYPNGCGWGNSGSIYTNWFMSPDRQEAYRTLISGHLTILAEIGWKLGAAYLITTLLAIRLSFDVSRYLLFPLFIIYNLSMFTCRPNESLPCLFLYSIACCMLVIKCIVYKCDKIINATRLVYIALTTTGIAIFYTLVFFMVPNDGKITVSYGGIFINNSKPQLLIIYKPNPLVLSEFYGKTARTITDKNLLVIDYLSNYNVPTSYQLVVSGDFRDIPKQLLEKAEKIICVNPYFMVPGGFRQKSMAIVGEYSIKANRNAALEVRLVSDRGETITDWNNFITY